MSLYKLADEMERLLDDENADETALQRVFGDVQKSAQSLCQYMANLDGEIDMFKAEEARLAERRKAIENRQAQLKQYLKDGMERLAIDKLKAGTFTIALQDSPPSVDVSDESKIPPRFFITVPATHKLDKKGVGDALKKGETVPGAELKQGKHIRIR